MLASVSRAISLASLFLLLCNASLAQAQEVGPYPALGTKQQQWQYVTALASQAFAIKASEATLTGTARKQAFRQRGVRFYRAANALRMYVNQHFSTETAKQTPAYVYAVFTAGLYYENAGEVWRARSWYREASEYNQTVVSAGQVGPRYNGTAIRILLPSRLERVTRLANMSNGVHPEAEATLLFSDGDDYAAGVEFLLEREAQIGDLFGPPCEVAVTDRPPEGDAP